MRILIVSIYYKPEPVPKPHELAEGLAKRGHQVTVLTGFPNYPLGRFYPGYSVRLWRKETVNGVRVIRVPIYPDHSANALLRAAHYVSFFISALVLGPMLGGAVDIVYVWGNPPTSGLAGWIISRLRRARFVYGVHDLWPELALVSGMVRSSVLARMIDALERFVLGRADLVLAISQGFKQKILQKGILQERVHAIPHWADGELYRPLPLDKTLQEELGWRGRFVLLYAGNVGRLQGLDNLVEAAALLQTTMPSLLVVIVGDGVERESLKRVVSARQGSNVVFIDPKPPETIVAYSGVADVLYVGLKSSSLAPLSVPSKVQTYLACGRPVLCNVPGETSDLVDESGVGINCMSDTPEGIAEALRRIAAVPVPERAAMGRRAREVFLRDFAMVSLLKRHEDLMEALLG
jgi:glycosyltransferase involved in cell wall biosynthesis